MSGILSGGRKFIGQSGHNKMEKLIITFLLFISSSAYATEIGTLKPSFIYDVIGDVTQSTLSSNNGTVIIDIPPLKNTIIIREVKRASWSNRITDIYNAWLLLK